VRHILIVEDEPLVHDAIKAAFDMKGGFDVVYAGDGQRAIAAITQRPFDLAIVDAKLPKISGIAVAEHAAAYAVPVILMSGHPDILLNPGLPFPVLAKPFRVSDLVENVDRLLAEGEQLRLSLQETIHTGPQDLRPDLQAALERWVRTCDRLLSSVPYGA
jgi:DNA-binding response OmpR family regulator